MNYGSEFVKRLRIGSALVAGFFLGQYLAGLTGEWDSGNFVFGFLAGVLLVQGGFWVWDRIKGRG
jgi:hypothetical protein